MKESRVDEIIDVVLSASRALVAIAARSLAGVDEEVTLPEYRAVVVLCAKGAMTMGELAGELGSSPSTATRLCDRLVAKGLIERQVRAENRREVEVAVAAPGRRLVDEVTGLRRVEIERIVANISPRERSAVVRAMRTFGAAAGEAPDEAWATGWDL
ncbi:MarR family transcriptional regulator [Aquihabitans sp. G128]|uniref:MarR family winged helix-turn-helix transcriptional regulator n=1 Tax=Aquihabitans sp. G128 TaxID=2849779 RepID=UPI001C227451|nr:MarR family transcriptional regulator [Aquihabitans sp. G128]QXC59651.1 MarR family transcriptional regulator [Aquihabitans sp. G128]